MSLEKLNSHRHIEGPAHGGSTPNKSTCESDADSGAREDLALGWLWPGQHYG